MQGDTEFSQPIHQQKIMEKEEILTTEPVVEAPKRKRGRPSKAELEARRQLELNFASTPEEEPAKPASTPEALPQEGESASAPTSGDDAAVAPKRRRRTKAEIIAAAALAAEALAKKTTRLLPPRQRKTPSPRLLTARRM